MKFSLIASAIALLFESQVAANTKRCLSLSEVDYDKDYFPDKASPQYAEQWDISYHNTYKILTNSAGGTSYLMYQCGTQPPASEAGKHNLTFSVPLQDGLVVTSTTQVPQLEQLGLR